MEHASAILPGPQESGSDTEGREHVVFGQSLAYAGLTVASDGTDGEHADRKIEASRRYAERMVVTDGGEAF